MTSKCGRYDEAEFDFSAARVKKSVQESLQRLHLDYLDLLHCHDVEFVDLDQVSKLTCFQASMLYPCINTHMLWGVHLLFVYLIRQPKAGMNSGKGSTWKHFREHLIPGNRFPRSIIAAKPFSPSIKHKCGDKSDCNTFVETKISFYNKDSRHWPFKVWGTKQSQYDV